MVKCHQEGKDWEARQAGTQTTRSRKAQCLNGESFKRVMNISSNLLGLYIYRISFGYSQRQDNVSALLKTFDECLKSKYLSNLNFKQLIILNN